MKKIFSAIFVSALFFSVLTAQVSVDPQDSFYDVALRWHIQGIVPELPQVKPYTTYTIQKIILSVIELGDEKSKKEAKYFFEKIFDKPWNVLLETNGSFLTQIYEKPKEYKYSGKLNTSLFFGGDKLFSNNLGLGYDVSSSFSFFNFSENVFGEKWAVNKRDSIYDTIKLQNANIDFSANAVVSYTFRNLNFSLGYNRVGFGVFNNGSNILNQDSFNSPQFTFSYDGKIFDFLQYFAVLRSSDEFGNLASYNKFILFHSFRFTITQKFRLTFYDSVVYGNRFDFSYFILVPSILLANANGYDDNVLAGLLFEYNVIPGFSWVTDFTIDKLDIPNLSRLKLTSDNRIIFKTGFLYSPKSSLCDLLSLDYTIILPNVYSSSQDLSESYDYRTYTNSSRSLGHLMFPNSDKIALKIKLNPINNFTLSTSASITRHANIYESYSKDTIKEIFKDGNEHSTDGSVYSKYYEPVQFLSQKNIMYVSKGEVEAAYRFPKTKVGLFELSTKFSYTYIMKGGVDNPIYTGKNVTDEQIDTMYKNWQDNLKDEYNILLSIGVKWKY